MMTMSQLTELLGWVSVVNIAYLMLATLIMMTMKDSISAIHKKMFDIDKKTLEAQYFSFLANYKVVTLALMVAPYIALKIMGY